MRLALVLMVLSVRSSVTERTCNEHAEEACRVVRDPRGVGLGCSRGQPLLTARGHADARLMALYRTPSISSIATRDSTCYDHPAVSRGVYAANE